MKKIELNVELESEYGTLSPSSPDRYPSFSFVEDSPCDLPDEGILTIEYRLVRNAEDTTDPDHPRYSYTICVEKLIDVVPESEPVNGSYDEAGDALDKIAAEKMKEKTTSEREY